MQGQIKRENGDFFAATRGDERIAFEHHCVDMLQGEGGLKPERDSIEAHHKCKQTRRA